MSTDNQIFDPVFVTTILTLKKLDNDILASANLGISGFGKIGKFNLAYEKMKDLSLIDEDGYAKEKETLLKALSHIINERVKAGLFS